MNKVSVSRRCAVCVPTLNPGPQWKTWLERTLPALNGASLLVVDSSSVDDTAKLAHEAGAEVIVIDRSDFDHGGTRDMALRYLDGVDVVVFLTQDALPVGDDCFSRLVASFENPEVGAAFGRQLPHYDSTAIAAHARLFNYPPHSRVVDRADISRLGIKTAFLSNSFAAYRREALLAAGGFPHGTILSEDMIAGARLLQRGWKLAYCGDARVQHSHNYSLGEEFRRYFDIGVLHRREAWLIESLGRAEGEGARFVRSEITYLLRYAPYRLPEAALRTLMKYIGYRLGQEEERLPVTLRRYLSMHRGYWKF